MEKKNKYYDLISSLVKNHRKYPGLEAILDDIIDDVYSHSKVIIDSVTNEEVILTYLSKVVSTSIITVPKKMDFNTRVRHRVIISKPVENETVVKEPVTATQVEVTGINDSSEVVIEQLEPETELTISDLDENTVKTLVENSEEETKEVFEESFEDEIIENIEEVDSVEEFVAAVDETLETLNDNLLEEETEALETDLQSKEPQVDRTLVDKMINGTTESFIKDENETLEENVVLLDDDIVDFIPEVEAEVVEALDEEPETLVEEIVEDELLEEPVETLDEESETLVEEVVEDELLEEPVETLDEEPETLVEEVVEDELLEEPVETLDEEPESLVEEVVEDELLEKPVETLDEEPETLVEEVVEDELLEEPVETLDEEPESLVEDNNTNFSPIDYNRFSYKPEADDDFDAEEIYKDLKDVQKMYSNLNINTLCDLKFNQKKSISEIAELLNASTSDIVDALTDIIEVVKD